MKKQTKKAVNKVGDSRDNLETVLKAKLKEAAKKPGKEVKVTDRFSIIF